MINIYTPNPIPVQALFFDDNNVDEVENFIGKDICFHENDKDGKISFVAMSTPNGYVIVPKKYWVVKDCMGQIRFYSDDAFREMFVLKEAVTTDEDNAIPSIFPVAEELSEVDLVQATDIEED